MLTLERCQMATSLIEESVVTTAAMPFSNVSDSTDAEPTDPTELTEVTHAEKRITEPTEARDKRAEKHAFVEVLSGKKGNGQIFTIL